jgi:hypothetical protein
MAMCEELCGHMLYQYGRDFAGWQFVNRVKEGTPGS